MYRDTDGYIIIDLKGIDVSRASQSVPGLYEKVEPVLDANKLVIVNNAGNHTPLPGSCIKSSNYIRITTDIYIFTINSNNILIIEANGSSITVDVSIIPAYSEGTKIADFEINGQSGELYIPAYPDIINDSVASDHTVYSSDKVNTLLSGKADTSAIPTKTSELDNDSGFITSSDIPVIPDILNDLLDVDISSASDAQVLTYDAISGKWVNATSPSGVTELSQLSDVTIASASDGNVLTYDSTSGKWVNEAIPSGVTTLDGLSDVSLTTPASGNALVYDGTEWVNDTLAAADSPYSAGVSVADKLYIEGSSTVGDTVWSYRKWNSGILEIWGKYSHAVSDSYHTWGSWYAYDVPSMGAYPISFIALHSTVVNFGSNVNIGMIGVKANANPLTNAPEGLLVRPTQGGVETHIYGDLYAKGTWK